MDISSSEKLMPTKPSENKMEEDVRIGIEAIRPMKNAQRSK